MIIYQRGEVGRLRKGASIQNFWAIMGLDVADNARSHIFLYPLRLLEVL